MDRWQRRTGYYLATLVVVITAYTAVYHYGMIVVEGRSATVLHSLQVVVETFTTTGFGSDAPWESPVMNLLVVAMDLTGVLLIFMALPVFFFPMLEETFTTTAPTAARDVEDHVVVCGYSSRGEALIAELEAREVPHVVVEPNRDRAADIYETDASVIHADPETVAGLESASIGSARAVVADVDDEANASIALTARGLVDVPIITFVEEPEVADYHRYAGADEVFSPRQLVGESLAGKVEASVTAGLDDATEIGDDFEIVELPVQANSPLAGRTVAQSGIRERTGTNVVGAWFRGEFESPPSPESRIDGQTILLVAGRDAQLEQVKELTLSERRGRPGGVLVAGYGEVGSTVTDHLESAGIDTVVVDREPKPDVDVVGDVTDEATLSAAGIEEAGTVILTLPDDTVTVFATLVVREVAPEVEIIARADATGSVDKLYKAGADYVLALATVSGRMLAATILEDDVISFDQQVEVFRTRPGPFAGRTLGEADVRARTGCTVIAVERDGELLAQVGPEFRIQPDDRLVVAGTDADVNRFAELVD